MTQPMPATLRKAAVLIYSLDADSADELLEQMTERQAERVRAAIMDLGEVNEAEQRTVMAEFLRGGIGGPPRASGRQGGEAKATAMESADKDHTHDNHTDDDDTHDDHAHDDHTDDEYETPWDEVDSPLTSPHRRTSPANQTVAPTHGPEPTCNGHESPDPSAFAPRLTDFEDLAGLDDEGLARLLQSVDPEITLLALAGAGQGMARRVLEPLDFRQSRALQRRMAQMGPMRLTDIDGAQQRMLRAAERLMADGHVRQPAGIENLPGGDYGEDH